MKKSYIFKKGRGYKCFSPYNTSVIWTFFVKDRTDTTLRLAGRFPDEKTEKKVRIKVAHSYGNDGDEFFEETCKPLGNYSMSPTLHASELLK